MGKLQEMYDLQEKLQNRLGYDMVNMTMPERTAFIKEFTQHADQELHEMLRELPFFKPWKDYSKMSEEDQIKQLILARKEFIDFIHFALNIGLALGLNESSTYDMYCEKNGINHERQDNGY